MSKNYGLPAKGESRLPDPEIAFQIRDRVAELNAWIAYAVGDRNNGLVVSMDVLTNTAWGEYSYPYLRASVSKPL